MHLIWQNNAYLQSLVTIPILGFTNATLYYTIPVKTSAPETTPWEHGTQIYIAVTVAAVIKTTMETQVIMTQWPLPHNNYEAPIKMPTSTQHSVDISVKQTMGCTKWRIVCTWCEPGTRVYTGISAVAPIIPTTKPHVITTQWPQDDKPESPVLPSSIAHLPSPPKLDDKPYYLMQLETKDLCTAGPNSTTPMPNQKHPAFPGQTLKSHDIYISPGYKMVSSLNSINADKGSNHQPRHRQQKQGQKSTWTRPNAYPA